MTGADDRPDRRPLHRTDLDAVGEYGEFDPSLTELDAPFIETTLDYVRRELGYREDDHLVYERLSPRFFRGISPITRTATPTWPRTCARP